MDNTLKKGKKRGERELKTTTKIKMEKKEKKKSITFFFLLWKSYERKEFILVYCKALDF